jgi:sulfotransferase family protein
VLPSALRGAGNAGEGVAGERIAVDVAAKSRRGRGLLRMAVEISGVTLCPSNDLITAAGLDYPRTGPVDGYAFEVSGWVVSNAPVAEVRFIHEGSVVARCELTVPRRDVASLYDASPPVGFWTAIGTVGLAPAFTIWARVVFQDGRQYDIAEIRGTQQLTSTFTPSMQPIMVTSPGRSGSTLLMRMLAEHPDIVVEERFPYETYVCSYWMHFLQVLARPMTNLPVESHELWADLQRLSPFPYFFIDPTTGPVPPEQATVDRWYATDQIEEFARVAQAAVESFYRVYASARNRKKPAFFAEKIVPAGHVRRIMRLLYPGAREIFLIRDPRDTLVSQLAFHANPPGGFDVQSVGTDEQLVNRVRDSILALTQLWKRRSQYDTLVRYEDLICSPTERIRAMLDAIGLDSSSNIVESMVRAGKETTANVNSHRTSPNVASSIGRWKRDLEPRLQKFCDEAFDGLLDEVGGSSC